MVIAQVAGRLHRRPRPPPGHDLRRDVGEQPGRKSYGPDPVELAPLALAGVQADVAGIGPDRRPRLRSRHFPGLVPGRRVLPAVRIAGVIASGGDHRPHPGRDLASQAAADLRGQHFLRLPQRRADHPAEPDPAELLNPLLAQPHQQRRTNPLGPAFPAAEPRRPATWSASRRRAPSTPGTPATCAPPCGAVRQCGLPSRIAPSQRPPPSPARRRSRQPHQAAPHALSGTGPSAVKNFSHNASPSFDGPVRPVSRSSSSPISVHCSISSSSPSTRATATAPPADG